MCKMYLRKTIRYSLNREKNFLFNFLNYLFYAYKRERWRLSPSRFWRDFEEVEIEKPVFMLGVHGGGLTLISRMLRRHKDFVSVSGNHKYWSGADEMAIVLGSILPPEFSGVRHKIPAQSGLKNPTNWLYAADKYIGHFRKEEADYSIQLEEKFKRILKWTIYRNAINPNQARFIDKSQIYTVRIPLLAKALQGSSPHFLLVTRNPYAVCYRVARGPVTSYEKIGVESFEKALKLASQHWRNSMKCTWEDGKKVENFLTVKFEDALRRPEETLKKTCNFAEIDFTKDLLPKADQKIPFGTKGYNKWYPLRSDVNQKYFNEMSQKEVEIIDSIVRDYADKFDYNKPKLQ